MATHLATPGSHTTRRLSAQPTPAIPQPQRLLNVQVALKGAEHSEPEGSVRFVDEEGKSLAV